MAIAKLAAKNSDITIKLKADSANPGQSLDLTIDEAEVGKGMTLRADRITIHDLQQSDVYTEPMTLNLGGATQARANHLAVNLTAEQGVIFDQLNVNTAQINAAVDDIWFTDAVVGNRMELATNQATILDARRHTSIADANILLNTESDRFNFSLVKKDMAGIENLVYKPSNITYNGGFNTLNIGINTVAYQMSKEQERHSLANNGLLAGEENGRNGQGLFARGPAQETLVDVTKLVGEEPSNEEEIRVDGEKKSTED